LVTEGIDFPISKGIISGMIYLDYAATTPVDSRVIDVMTPYFNKYFGNPSSIHKYGQVAEAAVEESRERVAACISCDPKEVVFTSCGSESDNLALRGTVFALREERGANRIVTARTEHHAVSKTAEDLEKHHGFQVEWLEVDKHGMVSAEAVQKTLDDKTAIVSVMYANNEIGTVNPIKQIAEVCRAHGVPFHTDAVQAGSYLPVEVDELGVDMLSLGGHKFYGPKGIGVLYVRKGTPLFSQMTGGGQENDRRAGTSNVPYIVGFAEALRLSVEEREERGAHVRPLRDRITGIVLEEIPDSRLTGHPESRLPNHASFAFKGVDGNTLLQMLDAAGFACSSGSACKTGNPEPSEVITEIGLEKEWGLGSLRVTLGKGTKPEDIDQFASVLPGLVEKSRSIHQG
jgi:cysteine desulfurase